jgi:CheY-like chemotaxis protein
MAETGEAGTIAPPAALTRDPSSRLSGTEMTSSIRRPTTVARKPRVLVVEDEALIAVMVEDFLDLIGCEVVGPISHLPTALQAAENADIDAAILNLVIGGKNAYAVAEILSRRGIPFGFASGVPRDNFDDRWRNSPHLPKPYGIEDVRGLMTALLTRPGSATN